jgi:ABC-2 type transport system permease protein
LDGTLTVLTLHRLSLLQGRRGIGLGLLCLVPLIPAVVGLIRGEGEVKALQGFAQTLAWPFFRQVNLIVFLFLGCAALGEEIDGKTLPYLLTRSLPRSALVIGRFLSYWLTTLVLLGVSFLVSFGLTVGQMGMEALWVDLPYLGVTLAVLACAAAAYGAVFVLLSIWIRRPLLVGLVFVFLWEVLAVGAPAPVHTYTLLHHVYVLLAQWTDLLTFVHLASAIGPGASTTTAGDALMTLGTVTVVALALSIWRFRRQEYTF